ncbi:hypothetical protein V8C34DRAFT_207933 [Trichoderma compactum]
MMLASTTNYECFSKGTPETSSVGTVRVQLYNKGMRGIRMAPSPPPERRAAIVEPYTPPLPGWSWLLSPGLLVGGIWSPAARLWKCCHTAQHSTVATTTCWSRLRITQVEPPRSCCFPFLAVSIARGPDTAFMEH